MKKRINLSLEPELYDLFSRLSAAEGKPMATIITNMLTEMSPALTSVLSALERANEDKAQAIREMREITYKETEKALHVANKLGDLSGD